MLSVLYIHPTGVFGGASRSLFELLRSIPHDKIHPQIILPKGKAAGIFRRSSFETKTIIGVPQFDNTNFGYYRGLRWMILFREIVCLPFFLAAVLQNRKKWLGVSLIHVSEITAIIPALIAKIVFRVPLVMHVRSVQAGTGKTSLRSRFLKMVLSKHVDAIIAIDETVKQSLPNLNNIQVVHNSFNKTLIEEVPIIRKQNKPLKIAMVGTLLELKGVFDFLRAAKICLDKGLDIEFIIVGEDVRRVRGVKALLLEKLGFSQNVRSRCEDFISENGLSDKIKLVGFNFEIDKIYREIDILCFPSHLEAVGRPVFEAAFFKIPSIVAITNPLPDTFQDKVTGMAVMPKSPAELAKAMEYLYNRPEEIDRMGQQAYNLAVQNFDSDRNAKKVLEIYREVMN